MNSIKLLRNTESTKFTENKARGNSSQYFMKPLLDIKTRQRHYKNTTGKYVM
jgi:hypothetical protein